MRLCWIDSCSVGRLTAGGQVLEDTKAKGRPALFTFGSRPLPSGLCMGVEEALASMHAGECAPFAGCSSCVCSAPHPLSSFVHMPWYKM